MKTIFDRQPYDEIGPGDPIYELFLDIWDEWFNGAMIEDTLKLFCLDLASRSFAAGWWKAVERYRPKKKPKSGYKNAKRK